MVVYKYPWMSCSSFDDCHCLNQAVPVCHFNQCHCIYFYKADDTNNILTTVSLLFKYIYIYIFNTITISILFLVNSRRTILQQLLSFSPLYSLFCVLVNSTRTILHQLLSFQPLYSSFCVSFVSLLRYY